MDPDLESMDRQAQAADSSNSQSMNHQVQAAEKKITKTIRVPLPYNPRPQCGHESVCLTQLLMQNHSNFKRSGAPSRIMFYDGSWVDFSDQVFRVLRSGFVEGKPMVEASVDGCQYLFDFLRMLQIDFATGNQRSIAWIDDGGKCFFPQRVVAEEFGDLSEKLEDMKIEIEIKVDGNSLKRKKELVEEQSDQVSSSFPKRRAIAKPDLSTCRWHNARFYKEEEKPYELVKKFFLLGVGRIDPGATVTSICHCTRNGPRERARFEIYLKQREITKAARGTAHEIYSWYGTSAQGVANILTHGFRMPSSKSHGVGLYLSPVSLPQLSAMQSEVDDNGEKHVILCRVILGNVEKVQAGSRQSHPSSANFDTGVDDVQSPKCYVVWLANMNTHVLPECVVSFKSSNPAAGQMWGSPLMKWVPEANCTVDNLLSKLNISLPSKKVLELEALCNIYKAGKVPRDVFMKQLRLVVGDEMLLPTIREMPMSNEMGGSAEMKREMRGTNEVL